LWLSNIAASIGCSEVDCGGGGGGWVAVGDGVGAGCVAVGAGAVDDGAWVGACVGTLVRLGARVGAVVAEAAGARATLIVFGVAVGLGALLLLAVEEDGFSVAVGSGPLSEAAAGVLVAVEVADGSAWAKLGAPPPASSS
jgi:hypothetical protein